MLDMLDQLCITDEEDSISAQSIDLPEVNEMPPKKQLLGNACINGKVCRNDRFHDPFFANTGDSTRQSYEEQAVSQVDSASSNGSSIMRAKNGKSHSSRLSEFGRQMSLSLSFKGKFRG